MRLSQRCWVIMLPCVRVGIYGDSLDRRSVEFRGIRQARIGDIALGATAFWVASRLATPSGRRTAILFNVCGLADLVVAVGLGITTNAGRAQVFHTVPTSELVTYFPQVLVPTFLVPLAFALHVISLRQLMGSTWMHPAGVTAA